MDEHAARYQADADALATEAVPPLAVFEHGRDWLPVGKDLRGLYGRVIRQALDGAEVDNEAGEPSDRVLKDTFEAARETSARFLGQWPAAQQSYVLLGAAAYLYAEGCRDGEPVRDSVLWQLGERRAKSGRERGVAQMMLDALRQIGLLGEPVWTSEGAVLYYEDAPSPRSAGVPVSLNGVWFNFLKATKPGTPPQMSRVPKRERDEAKARIADFVADQFVGMTLTTDFAESGRGGLRVITRTPHGNLFGYVQRDHELHAVRHDQWRIAWAMCVDGNVRAILEPAVAEAVA